MNNDDKYEYRHADGSRFCHPKGDPRYVAPDAGAMTGGIDAETVERWVQDISFALHGFDNGHRSFEDMLRLGLKRFPLPALARQSLPASGEVEHANLEIIAEQVRGATRATFGAMQKAYAWHVIDITISAFVGKIESAALTPVTSHADAGDEWRPIATAPNTGQFLGGRWDDGIWRAGVLSTHIYPFTHWRPLPAAPRNLSPRAASSEGGDRG